MKKIRLGLAGSGRRGVNVSRLFKMHPQCEVTACMDRFLNRAENAARELELPDAKVYDDFDKMLQEAPIDAIFFSCPPTFQADMACEAMLKGKHVCTEVPAAFTMDQCRNLVRTVEKTGCKYQLLEQGRFAGFIDVWKQMYDRGELGHVCLAQGEYVHFLPHCRNWIDVDTGEHLDDLLPPSGRNMEPSWRYQSIMPDPIYYLPHTLSPILKVLSDRVVRVSCMGTKVPGYTFAEQNLPWREIQYALMHTANDTVLLAGAGFGMQNVHRGPTECHWWELRGTKGAVTSPRHKSDWFRGWREGTTLYREMDIGLAPLDADAMQAQSGHGGQDFKPVFTFLQAILEDKETGMNVYQAVETAAPAILAVESSHQNGVMIEVPDFRTQANKR